MFFSHASSPSWPVIFYFSPGRGGDDTGIGGASVRGRRLARLRGPCSIRCRNRRRGAAKTRPVDTIAAILQREFGQDRGRDHPNMPAKPRRGDSRARGADTAIDA